jgi:hypothetical protein
LPNCKIQSISYVHVLSTVGRMLLLFFVSLNVHWNPVLSTDVGFLRKFEVYASIYIDYEVVSPNRRILPSFCTSLLTFSCRKEVKQQQTHPFKGKQHDGFYVHGLSSYPKELQVLPSSYLSCVWWFLFVGAVASSAATDG